MKYIATVLICLLTSIPISCLFLYELSSLPLLYRAIITWSAVVLFVIFWFLLKNYIVNLGLGKITIVALGASLGVFLSGQLASTPAVDNVSHATLEYSDGSLEENIKTQRIDLWGHIYNGYFLHPAYSAARVANSVTANFPTRPQKIAVLFSKPSAALLLPEGTPTLSDGVSIEISAIDSFGKIGISQSITLTQKDFLERHWIKKKVKLPSGIAQIKIKVTSGPPGSTPYYDSTLVAFEGKGVFSYIVASGRSLLIGMAISVIMLAIIRSISITRQNIHVFNNLLHATKRLTPFIALCFTLLMIVAWSISSSSYVYFWDYRNYWEKTEYLYELFSSWSWMQAALSVVDSYTADYTLIPAIIPALMSQMIGSPTCLNYAMFITIIYAIPAYIMVIYLTRRIMHNYISVNYNDLNNSWAYTGFVVLFFLPFYLGPVLSLMPDIGGVALYCGALILSCDIVKYITCCDKRAPDENENYDVICKCLSLGILMSIMFLFRRWYVFAIVGMVSSCVIVVVATIVVRIEQSKEVLKRFATSAVFVGCSAMLMLVWVVFEWSKNIGQHDYSKLYSSYQRSINHVYEMSIDAFGIIVPIIVVLFILISVYFKLENILLYILIMASIISSVLFLQVQSPGKHHFYLLMPLVGVCLSGFTLIIIKKIGHIKAAILFTVAVTGLIITGKSTYAINATHKLFPGYNDWLPKQQAYLSGYKQVSAWLLQPENKNLKFCIVASSVQINQGIFSELWQLDPAARHAFDGRLVYLGEVDSRDGPPVEGLKLCDLALVGSPFQTHLRGGEQYSVQIVQEDLTNGSGVGAAFERDPMTFVMDEYTKIYAYKRARQIANDEYADLVKRYLEYKAKTARTAQVE